PFELVDDVVGDHTTVVVSLVDDRAFPVLLRVEVARERRVAGAGSVREPDVRQAAARKLIDLAAVCLDPGARPEALLVRYRDDRHDARILTTRRLSDTNRCLMIRRALAQAVDIGGRCH